MHTVDLVAGHNGAVEALPVDWFRIIAARVGRLDGLAKVLCNDIGHRNGYE
jgi:hypothetical protein